MHKWSIFFFSLALLTLFSCSHQKTESTVSIALANQGLMKNHIVPYPVYITDQLELRADLEKKFSKDLYIIHTGHILKPNFTKEQNENILASLKNYGMNVVNLTLEDFAIAEYQGINFENYPQTFLNSSVVDITKDNLVEGKNILTYNVNEAIAFIGLSDKKVDKKIPNDKFIVSDYVLSVLKVKKSALKTATPTTIKSFVLIHNIGNEINEVMERLPPSFINSLAD